MRCLRRLYGVVATLSPRQRYAGARRGKVLRSEAMRAHKIIRAIRERVMLDMPLCVTIWSVYALRQLRVFMRQRGDEFV